jgi:diguanylate cyclase (GGDEF)-like protein
VIRPSLHQTLRRSLLAVVLVAVLSAGGLLTLLGTLALRQSATAQLQLVARSAGYSVEPALVFHDSQELFDSLALIAGAEDVAEATVFDLEGHLLTRWSRRVDAPWQGLQDVFVRVLLPVAVDEAVMHDGAQIGRVQLRGAGGGLVGFVLGGVGAILACLLLTAWLAASLMHRVLERILAPLAELADVVRAARVDRSLDRRVPAAGIGEFHLLGEDVNALLSELESRHDDLQRENANLTHRATHDSLTGLHNRAVFEHRLARAVDAAHGQAGRLALLFLDADDFKQINDGRGHAAGDAVLIDIGRRLRAQVRDQDVVARLGGDEFAILLDGLRGVQDAHRLAAAIEAGMREPVLLPDGTGVAVALSIGVALFPQDAVDAAGLLRAADLAMYRGKRSASRRRKPPALPEA